ncbi:MAG: Spermidine/putrescine import ATP-binding protein potA [Fibrobacteres bacterium]|nr:Spermidine/putrescine import ATP-binding protein potA [Fibrobacterota bacterium]
MPAYAIEGLTVAFAGAEAERPALSGVGFQVGAGELLVVLGRTGSGKTTLLRVMAGLQKAAAGRILEDGGGQAAPMDISLLPPHRRDMAMVFQNFSLYPNMTVRENLAFPLRAKAMGLSAHEIETRVAQAAETLALTDKFDRRPNELSGGELQRVAIGRALVRRPKLFLMDEPLASLDAKLRERMVLEIRRLQRSLGCGMIYVTHDHVEAMSLADRILVLDKGKVLQAGPPGDIYRHPVDSRVARMLGRPGINILTHEEAGRMGLPLSEKRLVGIRPESWKVTADAKGPAVAAVVEHLGPQMALVLDVQGIVLRVTAPPVLRAKAGDRFRLGVDPAEILYLDR